jgi:hypothetical protein
MLNPCVNEHDLQPMVEGGRALLEDVRAQTCSPECAGFMLALALSQLIDEWNLPPAAEIVDFARVIRLGATQGGN